jgi:hypothetical protein
MIPAQSGKSFDSVIPTTGEKASLHTKRQRDELEPLDSCPVQKRRICPKSCPHAGKRVSFCKHGHGGSSLCPVSCPTNALKDKTCCKSGHGGSRLCPVSCTTNALKQKKLCKSGHGGCSLCPIDCPTNALKAKACCKSGHGGIALCPADCPTNALKQKSRCKSGHGGCGLCPADCPTNALKRKSFCKSGHGGYGLCPADCPTNALKRKVYCRSGHGGSSFCPASCPTNACKAKPLCKSGHGGNKICSGSCTTNAFKSKTTCRSGHGGDLLCVGCFFVTVRKKGGLCKTCSPVAARNAISREARMAHTLNKWVEQRLVPLYTRWNRRNPSADPVQCGIYRVDFTYENDTGVLLLEYDESMHSDRDRRCELVRQANCSLGYGGRPVHWIRFNPDAFKVDGVTRKTSRKEREAELLNLMQTALNHFDYENVITIDYLCYNKPTSCSGSDLVQTYKFKTVEEYSTWVDEVAPVIFTTN